jgi:hypothetical protein
VYEEVKQNLKPLAAPTIRQDAVPTVSLDEVVAKLEAFLESKDGKAALELLRTSGRHIIFGESREGGGFGLVWFLGGTGLQESTEPMGTWVAYAQTVPEPKLRPISPRLAVQVAVTEGKQKPTEVMLWLEDEIEKIANEALAFGSAA